MKSFLFVGLMFVGGQYFSGSLERNVFGNVIGIILRNNEKNGVFRFVGI